MTDREHIDRVREWRVIGLTLAGVVAVIGLLLPSAYEMLADYQIEALREERSRLEEERRFLDYEIARITSPVWLVDEVE